MGPQKCSAYSPVPASVVTAIGNVDFSKANKSLMYSNTDNHHEKSYYCFLSSTNSSPLKDTSATLDRCYSTSQFRPFEVLSSKPVRPGTPVPSINAERTPWLTQEQHAENYRVKSPLIHSITVSVDPSGAKSSRYNNLFLTNSEHGKLMQVSSGSANTAKEKVSLKRSHPASRPKTQDLETIVEESGESPRHYNFHSYKRMSEGEGTKKSTVKNDDDDDKHALDPPHSNPDCKDVEIITVSSSGESQNESDCDGGLLPPKMEVGPSSSGHSKKVDCGKSITTVIPTGSQSQSTDDGNNATTSRSEASSSFLYIGPLGKKLRRCREKEKEMMTEDEGRTPENVPKDYLLTQPDGEEVNESDCSRSRSSEEQLLMTAESSPSNEETASLLQQKLNVTSTPTSVIRQTPRSLKQRDQPLNLSILSPPRSTSSAPPSSSHHQLLQQLPLPLSSRHSRSSLGERASVIRERLQSDGATGGSVLSPIELSQERLQDEAFGSPCCVQISPSSDFYSISMSQGSVPNINPGPPSSFSGPSSFQGLLMAQGINPQDNLLGCDIVDPGPNSGGDSNDAHGKKKFQCRECGKEFSQLRNYKYHRSRHEGTQQFACTCPICGKRFNDKGYLSSHLKIHRNEKEYKCEHCDKSFNQRVAYNMHVRIHTGHKPHECPFCQKCFSRKMLLRQHIRTHTGERPYVCAICGKAFADRSNMLLHQRLHSGERPYKCHICGKSFSKNHHLKTHLNHHAGIKPYKCEKCSACFSQSSNMKTHFKKCSGTGNGQGTSSTATSSSAVRQLTATTTNYEPSSQFQIQPERSAPTGVRSLTASSTITQTLTLRTGEDDGNIPALSSMQPTRLRQFDGNVFGLSTQPQQTLALQDPLRFQQQNPSHAQMSLFHSPTSRSSNSGHRGLVSLGESSPTPAGTRYLHSPRTVSGGERRPSGASIRNLSPTSLAAGHPFMSLTALESISLAAATAQGNNGLSSNASSRVLLTSPRRNMSGDLDEIQHRLAPMSMSPPRSHVTNLPRQRLQQQSMASQNPAVHDMILHHRDLIRYSNQLSPRQLQFPMMSPAAQSGHHQYLHVSPQGHLQASSQPTLQQDYIDIIFPALTTITRPSAAQQSSTHRQPSPREEIMILDCPEQFNDPRSQDMQRIYRIQNQNRVDNTPSFRREQPHLTPDQQGLLAYFESQLSPPAGGSTFSRSRQSHHQYEPSSIRLSPEGRGHPSSGNIQQPHQYHHQHPQQRGQSAWRNTRPSRRGGGSREQFPNQNEMRRHQ